MGWFGRTPKPKVETESKQRFRFYKQQPVKRMRRGPEGIILTMLAATPGQPGQQITISQADWDRYGEWRDLPTTRLSDVRTLVQD
jgi:hypothetical protein